MICPYCGNKDESMMEFLRWVHTTTTKFKKMLCVCCSKVFDAEVK